jgi:hypothetical protein
MSKRQKPKRQRYRRLVGPVELPKSDAELLAEAAREAEQAKRRGLVTGSATPPK